MSWSALFSSQKVRTKIIIDNHYIIIDHTFGWPDLSFFKPRISWGGHPWPSLPAAEVFAGLQVALLQRDPHQAAPGTAPEVDRAVGDGRYV